MYKLKQMAKHKMKSGVNDSINRGNTSIAIFNMINLKQSEPQEQEETEISGEFIEENQLNQDDNLIINSPIDFETNLNKKFDTDDVITINLTRPLVDNEKIQLEIKKSDGSLSKITANDIANYFEMDDKIVKIPVENLIKDEELKDVFKSDNKEQNIKLTIIVKVLGNEKVLAEHTYDNIKFNLQAKISFSGNLEKAFKADDTINISLSRELTEDEYIQFEFSMNSKSKKISSLTTDYISIKGSEVVIPILDMIDDSTLRFIFDDYDGEVVAITVRVFNNNNIICQITYDDNTFKLN